MNKTKNPPAGAVGDAVSLRMWKASDAETLYRLINDKAVVKYLFGVPNPYSRELADKYIRRCRREWRNNREFQYAVVLSAKDTFIGGIGIKRVDFTHGCGEIGFWLGRNYWGQGYGSEALSLLAGIAFGDLKLHRVYAHTMGDNIASQRVFEQNGFVREGAWREALKRKSRRQDIVHFGLLRREYTQLAKR